MILLLSRPICRFALSTLLAWLLAATGLFGAALWSGASAGGERPSAAEISAASTEHESDETPPNAPCASDEPEESAEALVALTPPSLELPLLKTGTVAWRRLSLLEPSSISTMPAYEPPVPPRRLG